MSTTAKKTYSLVSAILLVVLSALLFVGALMPVLRVNMANVQTAEFFAEGSFTEGLVVDEAKIGLGGIITLLKNYKYVSFINKYQRNEAIARKAEQYAIDYPDAVDVDTQLAKAEIAMEENDRLLMSFTEADREKLAKLFQNERFVDALYVEIAFVSLFSDAAVTNKAENSLYTSGHMLSVVTMIFGSVFVAGLMVCLVIFSLVSLISALKRAFALLTGYNHIDAKKLESLFPSRATTALLPTLFFFTMAKALLGSKLVLGAGMVVILVAFTLLSLLRVTGKIILRERRNPKHIARALVGLASFILVLLAFHNITNMNLVEAYCRSSDVQAYAVYETAYEEAYEEELLGALKNNTKIDYEYVEDMASESAKEAATEILSKRAFPLLFVTFLLSILTFALLSTSFNRLRENNEDTTSAYGAEKCPPYYVLATFVLGAVLLSSTFGVTTVAARDQAYLEGKVAILWDDYTLENSGVKETYEELTDMHTELLVTVAEYETALAEVSDEELKAEYAFEITMANRLANKLALKAKTLENNDTARRKATMMLLGIIIVLEVIYRAAPDVVEKYLPDSVKRFLEQGGRASAYSAPAPTPAPAPQPAPAPKQTPPASQGSSSASDLEAEMQRMYDANK